MDVPQGQRDVSKACRLQLSCKCRKP